MTEKETNKQNDVSINGNMDGNIIVGNGNQINVSSNNKNIDKTASELAILRLEKEIEVIKNADLTIAKIKREYSLPLSSTFDYIKYGLIHVIAEVRKQEPASSWKKFLGESGYTDEQLNAVFKSIKVDEIEAMKMFYAKIFDSYKKPPTSAASYAVRKITEDLEKIKELEESKALPSKKLEELQKHRQIVEML
jgi:hypothetical protein